MMTPEKEIDLGLYIGNQTFAEYIESLQGTYFHYDIFDILRKIQSFGVFDVFYQRPDKQQASKKIFLNQDVSLKFDVNAVDKIYIKNDRLYISVNGVGLLSINSPLPKHLLEHIFERFYLHGDRSWLEFINFLQSRSLFLFYKSWDVAQNFNSLDKCRINYFNSFIASLIGINTQSSMITKNSISLEDKLYFSGFYLSEAKSAKNISKVLSMYFSIPVQIVENFGIWHKVDETYQTKLSTSTNQLSDGLLLGSKVFDKQSKFRIILGPIDFQTYLSFLKGGLNYHKLKDWMNFLAFSDFDWDYQLILLKDQTPSVYTNSTNQLGLTAWLGYPKCDVDDMIVSH